MNANSPKYKFIPRNPSNNDEGMDPNKKREKNVPEGSNCWKPGYEKTLAYLKYSASLGNALNAEREKEKATESTKCKHSACFAQGEELTDINV